MASREHSVIVDPTHYSGPIHDLARILVPLIGQPSRTLISRLERGEITIQSDLSQIGADALVDRLSKMGVTAMAQKKQTMVDLDLDFELDLPSDFDLDAIFLSEEEPAASAPSFEEIPAPTQSVPDTSAEANPWEALFPDLEKTGPKAETNKVAAKKSPPSLGDLETGRVVTQPLRPTPPPKVVRQQPRAAESMMRDIIPTAANKPTFYPKGFDDTYEHSPQLAAIFSILAPGAGQRYNGEDEKARSTMFLGVLVWPWIRSIKQTRQSAEKIQSYHLKRPEGGALNRTLVHIAAFWIVLAVIATVGNLAYRQFAQHSEIEASGKTIAIGQVSEAIISARLKHAEARFAGLEKVRATLAVEPKQEISMTPEEHLERLYAVGVERCRAQKFAQCQGIMARVSRLNPGYRDVLVLQTWASQQRTTLKRTPMPKISEVKTLDEIEAATP